MRPCALFRCGMLHLFIKLAFPNARTLQSRYIARAIQIHATQDALSSSLSSGLGISLQYVIF